MTCPGGAQYVPGGQFLIADQQKGRPAPLKGTAGLFGLSANTRDDGLRLLQLFFPVGSDDPLLI